MQSGGEIANHINGGSGGGGRHGQYSMIERGLNRYTELNSVVGGGAFCSYIYLHCDIIINKYIFLNYTFIFLVFFFFLHNSHNSKSLCNPVYGPASDSTLSILIQRNFSNAATKYRFVIKK